MTFCKPQRLLKDNTEYINYKLMIDNEPLLPNKIKLTKELNRKRLYIKGLANEILEVSELLNNDEILRKVDQLL